MVSKGIGLDSVSPVMDSCEETPLLFHLFPYGFHHLGPSSTVNLNELIAYFSIYNITKPHFFTKSRNHWSLIFPHFLILLLIYRYRET